MSEASNRQLAEDLRRWLLTRGFHSVGFTDAGAVEDVATGWVANGHHASMLWMERDPGARARPEALLPHARTVVCVTARYPSTDGRGAIAGYARGQDYHRTMRAALDEAVAMLAERLPGVAARVCVDTAPLLERAFAARAGLGWIGRNTMLLNEASGPWLLLGEILLDVALPPDAATPFRCGTCTACVDACPTDALDGRGNLDARRCLSYWTIEHRGELPAEWAAQLGTRAFGCDDCLAACPFPASAGNNESATARADVSSGEDVSAQPADRAQPAVWQARPDLVDITPAELERRARESFRKHFGGTPLERARKGGLLRNLAHVRDATGD